MPLRLQAQVPKTWRSASVASLPSPYVVWLDLTAAQGPNTCVPAPAEPIELCEHRTCDVLRAHHICSLSESCSGQLATGARPPCTSKAASPALLPRRAWLPAACLSTRAMISSRASRVAEMEALRCWGSAPASASRRSAWCWACSFRAAALALRRFLSFRSLRLGLAPAQQQAMGRFGLRWGYLQSHHLPGDHLYFCCWWPAWMEAAHMPDIAAVRRRCPGGGAVSSHHGMSACIKMASPGIPTVIGCGLVSGLMCL